MRALDAVRIALERNRSIFDVRQYERGNPVIEIDHLSLGKTGFRIKYFVNIRKREFLVTDFDGQRSHLQILARHWVDAIINSLVKTLLARAPGLGRPFTLRWLIDCEWPVSVAADSTRKIRYSTHGLCR